MSVRLSIHQMPAEPEWTPPPVTSPVRGPRWWLRNVLLVLVAVVAGAGGGVAAQRIEGGTTAPATVTVSVAPAQRLAGTPLDVATVAAMVEPAVVRVEARLSSCSATSGSPSRVVTHRRARTMSDTPAMR